MKNLIAKKWARRRGFTLIELLVVIAIIGLLSSVVLASLSTARTKSRDARRKADLHNIQTALELYFDSYGYYPPPRPSNTCGGGRSEWATSYCTNSNWLSTDPNFMTYISSVPRDPVNKIAAGQSDESPWWYGSTYAYSTSSNSTNYDLITNLENRSDPQRCEVAYWFGQGVWVGSSTSNCWSSGTPGSVPDRAKQIYSVK